MKAIRFLSATAAVACIAFASACSDYVGKEATHPLYAKAMSAKTSKSYRESADSLEEFLVICPKSPKAHYDVALLYKENLENYPAAIYHLQKYLDLMGEALPKDDQAAIRRYIQDCERQMFDLYRVRNDVKLADDVPQVDPAKLTAKNNEIAALHAKLQKYIDNEKLILAQNEELRSRLAKASAAQQTSSRTQTTSAAASGSTSQTAARSGSVPSSTTGTPGTTIAGENGVRYYYVAKGDGLQAIAQKMYGKASMWKIIQDANKDTLGERGILKIGQKLVIPPAPAQ